MAKTGVLGIFQVLFEVLLGFFEADCATGAGIANKITDVTNASVFMMQKVVDLRFDEGRTWDLTERR